MNVMNTFTQTVAHPSREDAQRQAKWSATQSPKAQASKTKPKVTEAKAAKFFRVKFEDNTFVRFPFA